MCMKEVIDDSFVQDRGGMTKGWVKSLNGDGILGRIEFLLIIHYKH